MLEFTEIVLATRADAEKVLDELHKHRSRYGFATVSDYLDLVGITPRFSDTKVGWTDLNDVKVYPTKEGFSLNLPEPMLVGQDAAPAPQEIGMDREQLIDRLKKSSDALEGMIDSVMMRAMADDMDPYQMMNRDGTPTLAPLVAVQASTLITLVALGGIE